MGTAVKAKVKMNPRSAVEIHCPAGRNPAVVKTIILCSSERLVIIGVLRTILAAGAPDCPTREKTLSLHPRVSPRLQDRAPRCRANCDRGLRD